MSFKKTKSHLSSDFHLLKMYFVKIKSLNNVYEIKFYLRKKHLKLQITSPWVCFSKQNLLTEYLRLAIITMTQEYSWDTFFYWVVSLMFVKGDSKISFRSNNISIKSKKFHFIIIYSINYFKKIYYYIFWRVFITIFQT